jgi:hypothetical protein
MKVNEQIVNCPQQGKYCFGNVVFDSNFDSGNLGRVEQINDVTV